MNEQNNNTSHEIILQITLCGRCGAECEFCSGCDKSRTGESKLFVDRIIDGMKEIAEINSAYTAPFVK